MQRTYPSTLARSNPRSRRGPAQGGISSNVGNNTITSPNSNNDAGGVANNTSNTSNAQNITSNLTSYIPNISRIRPKQKHSPTHAAISPPNSSNFGQLNSNLPRRHHNHSMMNTMNSSNNNVGLSSNNNTSSNHYSNINLNNNKPMMSNNQYMGNNSNNSNSMNNNNNNMSQKNTYSDYTSSSTNNYNQNPNTIQNQDYGNSETQRLVDINSLESGNAHSHSHMHFAPQGSNTTVESFLTHQQKSASFLNKSTRAIVAEVSHEFDQFTWILMITAGVSLFFAFLTLSGSAFIVLTFVLVSCVGSFYVCSWLVRWIMKFSRGTREMQVIADYIKEGATSYLSTQYQSIAFIAVIVAAALFVIYLFRATTSDVSPFLLAIVTCISFLIGAFCSALAGYSGVWTSVRVNLRVAAAAAKYDYKNAFLLSFRGGAVSAILSAAMCILGISSLFVLSHIIFVKMLAVPESEIPLLLGGYGFGASFVALFMQLGGGIYTKAADVGADMVGKIEQNIPEDDPRNPAVIADLVGDNVGDCAGSMADVFESIAGEMIGTMILAGTLGEKCHLPTSQCQLLIFFPLIIHSLDLIVSITGIMLTLPKQNEDPIVPMKRGYAVALAIAVICYIIVCYTMLNVDGAPNAWWHYGLCGFVGLLCAYFLVLITQYYTDYTNKPVKSISFASRTGHGTNIIAGIAVGMESTGLPVIVISISLFSSYLLGKTSGLGALGGDTPEHLEEASHIAGLFGTACATMGMLCTAVFVLSMNNFGPIADNAGGVVEMSEQPSEVRTITDRLDAVGNVTKAATKGYAVGGSALACFLLFQAFLDEISILRNITFNQVDITKVEVMIGGLLGIMMVFLFTGWSIDAVGRTAERVVIEVRRQFAEIPGLMDFSQKPEYGRCVEIVTKAALREMIRPALLALGTPVAVGLLFRMIGSFKDEALLGVEVVASFLMFGTLTGLLMAIFLDNSGGAWDNAKKLIEATGQKGSEAHKAAVTGDTVGDPFKDTAGPALHVVITTMSTTALVLGPLFLGGTSSPN